MKLLIISGTPKKDGICQSLVTTAAESAAGLGAETEVIRLFDHKLQPCKMCRDGWGPCREEHFCKFGDEDDFSKLHGRFAKADAFVFITPVYWGDMSEAMKCFIDKLRRCEASRRWDTDKTVPSRLANKPSILVVSAGGSGNGILGALTQMEKAVIHMDGDNSPKETKGICDLIGVNRWNQQYMREALKASVASMVGRLK